MHVLALISPSNAMPESVVPSRRRSRPFSTDSSDSLDISICTTNLLQSLSKWLSLHCSVRTGNRTSNRTQPGSFERIPNNSEQLRKNSESKTTRKKNCARLRIFAHGLRIFCARLHFWFSPKCIKIVRKYSERTPKCTPN